MKYIRTLFLFLLFTACTHKNPLSDFNFQTVTAPPHVLASWYRITQPQAPVKFYIEGDVYAQNQDGTPTQNPTPKDPFLRKLAAEDPSPNVVYLGLPCQYFQTSICTPSLWTTDRFSKATVRTMEQSIRSFLKKARSQHMILIGYDSGAQLAGLVAIQHPEQVKHFITIGGILDPEAWHAYHNHTTSLIQPTHSKQSPLSHQTLPTRETTSISTLSSYKKELQTIPQTHYVGKKDKSVPPTLIQHFFTTDSNSQKQQIVSEKEATSRKAKPLSHTKIKSEIIPETISKTKSNTKSTPGIKSNSKAVHMSIVVVPKASHTDGFDDIAEAIYQIR